MDEEESAAKLTLKGHALLLPAPFQGHINPLMELGKRLAALGVRVTLVTTQHLHAKILRAQQALPQPITARHAHFSLVGIPDGLSDCAHSGMDLVEAVEKLEDPVLELVHTLASQGFPVTCIVADFFLRWSPSLACRTSLPEFIFWPQCASMLSIVLHVDAFIAAGYDPFDSSDKTEGTGPNPMDKVACVPGLSHHIRYADLPFQGYAWKRSVEWQEGLIRHRLKHLPKAQGVLVNSFEALEPEVCKVLTTELQQLIPNHSASFIGPLTASPTSEGSGTSLWEEEVEECMQWLDEQPARSVIYVAFGSIAAMSSKEQVQELARGLAKSGQRFLWVLRNNAIQFTSLKAEDALPHDFLEQTKGKGRMVRWAPQARVLSHPAVGGFFSHCGWNSILESINAGVPILGWPFLVDQFLDCRLVSHVWRTGLDLKRNSLNETTRVDVTHGVCELMQGPHVQDMRARAIQLMNLSKEALYSSREFLSFVDDIRN